MKVALVHELLHKFGGAERVLKVLSDMFPEAPIYTLLYDEKKTGYVFPKERVKTSFLQRYFNLIKRPQLLLPWMPEAIESFNFSGYDLVISSSSAFAHGIITPLETKHVCYCHSPMRYAWDYTHQYRKEKSTGLFGPIKNWMISRTLQSIRQWDRVASDRADMYLANSKEVRKRLQKYYNQDSRLVYPPVQINRFTPKKSAGDYFLVVSALTPFKRIDLAIEACNQLNRKLFIIGAGEQLSYLKSIAGPTVTFLGRLGDEATTKYLEDALALFFPGVDDFGIVPVEAMAAGTPVLAYKMGGVLDTVQEGETGEFFEEQSVEAVVGCVKRFLERTDWYDVDTIRKRAAEFSEDRFCAKLNEIL